MRVLKWRERNFFRIPECASACRNELPHEGISSRMRKQNKEKEMKADGYNFNYGWEFLLADAFPLTDALEAVKDGGGRAFYEREYQAKGWKEVSLPHTYNDEDLFVDRIQDAGSGQKRTFSCYRKWFSLKECIGGGKKTFSGEKCASEGEASGGEGVRRREGC